jgi:putative ABC transport system permease protein
MFRYLSLMVKNSLRNRRRTLLTIGSIAVSLCLLGFLFAMYKALFLAEATPAQALRLVCRHRVSLAQSLPIAYRQKIERIPGVKEVMVWQWFGGTYKDNRDPKNMFARFAAEPDRIFKVRTEFIMPEEQKLAFQHERTGCIISHAIARKLNLHLGDRMTLVGDIFPVNLDLKVVGIFDDPEDTEEMYFNRDYLRDALGPGTSRGERVGAFQIEADSPQSALRIAEEVDKMFENAPEPTKTETEQAFALSFASFLGNLKLFLMLICGAVTFTILLVSANTISMSVRERVREVGIMKTLGFTPGGILSIILGEAAFISLIGGALGCLLALMLCQGVRNSPAASYMPMLRVMGITPVVALVSLAVAVLIGVLSSVIPAWSASRTSILDSLRYTG